MSKKQGTIYDFLVNSDGSNELTWSGQLSIIVSQKFEQNCGDGWNVLVLCDVCIVFCDIGCDVNNDFIGGVAGKIWGGRLQYWFMNVQTIKVFIFI